MTKSYHPIRSLVWKEWREQRWRFALSALVLTTLSASMVRAQLIPTAESVAIIFGPLGLVLSVFMSMGAVPPERSAGTWHFLITQPMSLGRIVIVKWAVGATGLVATLLLAGVVSYLVAMSRGLPATPPSYFAAVMSEFAGAREVRMWNATIPMILASPIHFLVSMVVSACVAYLALYSLLFWAMLKARNELHAGLAGILLTIVILAWAAQFPLIDRVYQGDVAKMAWVSSLANPLSPIMFQFEFSLVTHALAIMSALLIWVGIPLRSWLHRVREVEK